MTNHRIGAQMCVVIVTGGIPALAEYCDNDAQKICCQNGTQAVPVYPKVCLDFDDLDGAPLHGTHFDTSYDVNDVPSIELIKGTTASTTRDWLIWSVDSADDEGELGSITIVDEGGPNDAHDFNIQLRRPTGTKAGASNIGSMDLIHPDGENWTGHSSLASSSISGDLTGALELHEDSGSDGGTLYLTVGGDVTASIDVGDVEYLKVDGSILANADFESLLDGGTIDVYEIDASSFTFCGDLDGDLTIDVLDASLIVSGDTTGDITIGTMAGGNSILHENVLENTIQIDAITNGALTIHDDYDPLVEFTGLLKLGDGIPSGISVSLHSALNGDIDFMNNDLAGTLFVEGGGDGEVKNVDELSGAFYMTGVTEVGADWTARFTSVSSGGGVVYQSASTHPETNPKIYVTNDFNGMFYGKGAAVLDFGSNTLLSVGGDLAGDVEIDGYYKGTIDVGGGISGTIDIEDDFDGTLDADGNVTAAITIGGDTSSSSSIDVGGYVSAPLTIDGAAAGDIVVQGNINQKVSIGDDLSGDVEVNGDANWGIEVEGMLKSTGRIMVDGLVSGDIRISEGTEGGSLIRATEGIDASTSVVINLNEEAFHAGGSMYFGDAVPVDAVPVTFDGNVVIKKCDTVANPSCLFTTSGRLNGSLTVRGCFDEDRTISGGDPLDICICGSGSPNSPTILQDGCETTYTVEDDCVTGCS